MFTFCVQVEDGIRTIVVRDDGTGLSTSNECYDEHENVVLTKEEVQFLLVGAKKDLENALTRLS